MFCHVEAMHNDFDASQYLSLSDTLVNEDEYFQPSRHRPIFFSPPTYFCFELLICRRRVYLDGL